jgi:hypothetical protein
VLNEIIGHDRGAEYEHNGIHIAAIAVIERHQNKTRGTQCDVHVAEHIKTKGSIQQIHRRNFGLKS